MMAGATYPNVYAAVRTIAAEEVRPPALILHIAATAITGYCPECPSCLLL